MEAMFISSSSSSTDRRPQTKTTAGPLTKTSTRRGIAPPGSSGSLRFVCVPSRGSANAALPICDMVGNFSQLEPINGGKIPDFFDWREMKMVSPVKDQQTCSACWAFSAVANIESHLKIYLGQEEVLSEQFLIDCDGSGAGCGSASVLNSFGRIVQDLGGVLRYSDYKPYANRQLSCSWKGDPKPIPVTGLRRVRSDEEDMARAVFKYGPLSAGINAASMAKYKGGIDEPTDDLCSPSELDHAVLIVGYNIYLDNKTGKRVPYWIIKNSWGVNWGEDGFYYLVRGRNACGIANDVSYATVN